MESLLVYLPSHAAVPFLRQVTVRGILAPHPYARHARWKSDEVALYSKRRVYSQHFSFLGDMKGIYAFRFLSMAGRCVSGHGKSQPRGPERGLSRWLTRRRCNSLKIRLSGRKKSTDVSFQYIACLRNTLPTYYVYHAYSEKKKYIYQTCIK